MFKKEDEKFVWLIGRHSGYHKWVLPKGLIEKGERGFETAIRETKEEMGVKASLVYEKPIQKVQYFYWADFKKAREGYDYEQSDDTQSLRRVKKYQESGETKTKVFKVVSFYLLKYKSGDPSKHDWEMSDAGWFSYKQALKKLAFSGERQALEKARDKMRELRVKS